MSQLFADPPIKQTNLLIYQLLTIRLFNAISIIHRSYLIAYIKSDDRLTYILIQTLSANEINYGL